MLGAKSGLCLLMLLASAGLGTNLGAGNDWSVGKSKICVITETESIHEFQAAIDRLEKKYGLHAVFVFPPHAVIGYVPDVVRSVIDGDHAIRVIDDLGMQDLSRSDLSPAMSAKVSLAWQVFYDPESHTQAKAGPWEEELPEPPPDDFASTDSDCRTDTWEKLTSEYLMGKVALGIFLMESNGHQEDWSNGPPDRPQSVWEKIIIGLNWMHIRHRAEVNQSGSPPFFP